MYKITHFLTLCLFCCLSFICQLSGAEGGALEVTGFWKTINEKTGKPESVIAIYSKDGKYYGRIVQTYNDDGTFSDNIYNPKDRAPGIVGNPYYAGMDIIWAMTKEGNKYKNGKIIDPERGDVYDAEMWRDKANLIVRGKILFLGQNQTWLPATTSDFPADFKQPDFSQFTPVKPEVKR